ncbi:hypothetical protein DNTS_009903 [Danionella cerebrum]|uniref:Uncharacterized protein n=1 Tax=Danionella cerebrum TaxID=2873325 RepID=A0A553RDQ5_9TELE|nr:hypothetical protein DNTS_009903 [Danionella translucida]
MRVTTWWIQAGLSQLCWRRPYWTLRENPFSSLSLTQTPHQNFHLRLSHLNPSCLSQRVSICSRCLQSLSSICKEKASCSSTHELFLTE